MSRTQRTVPHWVSRLPETDSPWLFMIAPERRLKYIESDEKFRLRQLRGQDGVQENGLVAKGSATVRGYKDWPECNFKRSVDRKSAKRSVSRGRRHFGQDEVKRQLYDCTSNEVDS